MLIKSAKIKPFKSINQEQTLDIDDKITVLVGMNESGKTVLLQALQKSNDALDVESFKPIEDYPRKDYTKYAKRHSTTPDEAITLEYQLTESEISDVNTRFKINLSSGFKFSVTHNYANNKRITMSINEKPVIADLIKNNNLSTDAKTALKNIITISGIPDALKNTELTDEDKEFNETIKARIKKAKWDNVVKFEIWQYLEKTLPRFLYFSEYDLLPSKMNLKDLAKLKAQSKDKPEILDSEHRSVIALLRMAEIELEDFEENTGYEHLKAQLEAVSITLTDQIMEFWKQNEDLEVEVDIKEDPHDTQPFNDGPNLYLRIKNKRHRGVSTPFRQRSRGFIWFFSFLVWFDSVQNQIDDDQIDDSNQIFLLLDEPALALHAMAQEDFLRYIDSLSENHQVIYTTHSPFMINSDRLGQVRLLEDKKGIGTTITDNLSGSDPRTLFPLQAALGWNLAQNLFISPKNILVEGPSELLYLKSISGILEKNGRECLREDITIVPVGGLDKVATFIALLGANKLDFAVFCDYSGKEDQRLADLVKKKLISDKVLLNPSQYRDLKKLNENTVASDTEDMFTEKLYLQLVNDTYTEKLNKRKIKATDLPKGNRIVERIERFLSENKTLTLRPSGGYNHYLVAAQFAKSPEKYIDDNTLTKFEELFKSLNNIV